jgi:hypothetical protein
VRKTTWGWIISRVAAGVDFTTIWFWRSWPIYSWSSFSWTQKKLLV